MNKLNNKAIVLLLVLALFSCGKIGGRLGSKLSREISESISKKSRKLGDNIDINRPKVKLNDLPVKVQKAILLAKEISGSVVEESIKAPVEDFFQQQLQEYMLDSGNTVAEVFSYVSIDTFSTISLDHLYNSRSLSKDNKLVYGANNSHELDKGLFNSQYVLDDIDSPFVHLKLTENYDSYGAKLERFLRETYKITKGSVKAFEQGDTLHLKPIEISYQYSLDRFESFYREYYLKGLVKTLPDDLQYFDGTIEKLEDSEEPRIYFYVDVVAKYSFPQGLAMTKNLIAKESPINGEYGFLFEVKVVCMMSNNPLN